MNTEAITDNIEPKLQFILDENGDLQQIPKDQCRPVEYPIKYRLKNAFEVFVRVNRTENYWISNYGRCVNNLNCTKKDKFYEHKQGKCHYTVFEIEREIRSHIKPKTKRKTKKSLYTRGHKCFDIGTPVEECNSFLEELQKSDEKRVYFINEYRLRRETNPAELVAETFLVKYKGRKKVWHKDGDEANNWYKNLITVTEKDYKKLRAGTVTWQELNLEQEYIEYENKAGFCAYMVYNGINARCNGKGRKDGIGRCYNKSSMCKEWLENPKAFVKWYLEHYYECEGESMAVDKDLFGDGSGMYHPDFCCILPQGLNALLSNCKKHYYKEGKAPEDALPLGVKYNGKTKKYYSYITFTGTEKSIQLSEWDTAEEAFKEYKMMKQANILRTAAEYKEKIPHYIYEKLLQVEVEPY